MKSISLALAALLMGAAPVSAASVTVLNAFGTWKNAVGGARLVYENLGPEGDGTVRRSSLFWGVPTGPGPRSSYNFYGSLSAGSYEIGERFILGYFIHNNQEIALPGGLEEAGLEITYDIVIQDDQGGFAGSEGGNLSASFRFRHNETPNHPRGGECPLGDPAPCDDIVEIFNNLDQAETFIFNDVAYTVRIYGVEDDQEITRFQTFENGFSYVELYGVVTSLPVSEIPLPPGMILMLSALGLLGARRLAPPFRKS